MLPRNLLSTGLSQLSHFLGCARASTATVIALALVPVLLAAGTGVDLGRAMVVRTRLAEALDAAGLAVGAAKDLSQQQMQALAQSYFSANYNVGGSFGIPGPVTVATGTNTVTVSDTVPMPTVLMKVVGLDTVNVGYTSQVTWGETKLWVSLVLDNTGSMTQTDSNGISKISALQTAATQLLSTLQGVAQNPGDIMVSIVPFTTGVNIGKSNNNASWLTFAPWDAVGAGDGAYRNMLGVDCQPGTQGCSWVPFDPIHTSWTGCVMDRNQDNDVENTAPNPADVNTLFPAAPPHLYGHTPANSWKLACPEQMVPLMDISSQNGYSTLTGEITGMVANGTTDQPIGFAMGWMTLTNSPPFNPGAMPSDTTPIVIIVSDGLNTQDRWTGDGSNQDNAADQREALVCTNMKAAGIIIYAVYVDLNGTQGNSAPLQNCASGPGDYFDLTTSGEIVTAFQQIGTQITQLHISK
ncbi:MAG TPA: TadE/TadG family type IV pilus assembly protein [Rhizomicrobium sp.]|jgi:Flp pilus assembly protein TadG|nr:TadE/TadG family type IV pilus assembly protein [Rhizomicrobium sp.]